MLPGDTPTKLGASPQRSRSGFDDPVQFPGCAHIEKDIWMEVTVAGMKNIGDPKVVLLADFGDAPHDFRQLAARYNTVLNVVVGRQSTHGSESAFPTLP